MSPCIYIFGACVCANNGCSTDGLRFRRPSLDGFALLQRLFSSLAAVQGAAAGPIQSKFPSVLPGAKVILLEQLN